MRPQDFKDEDGPPHSSRAPSSSRVELEEITEENSEASSQYGDDEEGEEGRESGAATAPGPVLRYRRRVDNPSSPLQGPPQLAPAQPSIRPQDPQTPPRPTSQGLERDLLRAGEVLRDQTRSEYHRRRVDAQEDYEGNANVETSSALAQAQVGVGDQVGVGGQDPLQDLLQDSILPNPHYSILPPVAPTLRRSATQQLGIGASQPFSSSINSFPQLPPQTAQTIGDKSASGGFGVSMAAMAPFVRRAAQAAHERQVARQENSPTPDRPHRRRRPAAPHPAHFQTPAQPPVSK